MSSTNDLADVQRELESRGMRDVKFSFTSDVKSMPNSDVTNEVAFVLGTYLRGDFVPFKPFGDLCLK